MAHVAIFTLWAWECPDCGYTVKTWTEMPCFKKAGDHLHLCTTPHKGTWASDPIKTTWAFNVVSDRVSRGAVTTVPNLLD